MGFPVCEGAPCDSQVARSAVFISALHKPLLQCSSRSIAVRTAADAACRITIAKLAATFVVTAPGAELRAVEDGEQSSAAYLPRDRGQRILRSGWTGRSILRGIVHTRAGAAIGVTHQHAPKLVHGDVVEVEQVSTRVTAARIPNAATLHGVGRCRVRGRPSATAV